jgi:hypothetical protein
VHVFEVELFQHLAFVASGLDPEPVVVVLLFDRHEDLDDQVVLSARVADEVSGAAHLDDIAAVVQVLLVSLDLP